MRVKTEIRTHLGTKGSSVGAAVVSAAGAGSPAESTVAIAAVGPRSEQSWCARARMRMRVRVRVRVGHLIMTILVLQPLQGLMLLWSFCAFGAQIQKIRGLDPSFLKILSPSYGSFSKIRANSPKIRIP